MSLEMDMECPECEEEVTFYRAAAMGIHLGEKEKWRCPECEYSFVQVGGKNTLDA